MVLSSLDPNKLTQLIALRDTLRTNGQLTKPPLPPAPTPGRTKHTRLNPHQRQEVLDRYQRGETYSQIARAMGVHRTTAAAIVRRGGNSLNRTKLTAAQQAKVQSLHQSGESITRIARQLKVTPGTISDYLKRGSAAPAN